MQRAVIERAHRPAGPTGASASDPRALVTELRILGRSVETARRYALPTHEDRHAAIGRLTTDA